MRARIIRPWSICVSVAVAGFWLWRAWDAITRDGPGASLILPLVLFFFFLGLGVALYREDPRLLKRDLERQAAAKQAQRDDGDP